MLAVRFHLVDAVSAVQASPSGEYPDGHVRFAAAVSVRVRFSHQHCCPAIGSNAHTRLRYFSALVHHQTIPEVCSVYPDGHEYRYGREAKKLSDL